MEDKDKQILRLTTDLSWTVDILERIGLVLKSEYTTEQEKLEGVEWLVKQGLKVKREE